LELCGEIIAVCSEVWISKCNAPCGESKTLYFKADGEYREPWALNGQYDFCISLLQMLHVQGQKYGSF